MKNWQVFHLCLHGCCTRDRGGDCWHVHSVACQEVRECCWGSQEGWSPWKMITLMMMMMMMMMTTVMTTVMVMVMVIVLLTKRTSWYVFLTSFMIQHGNPICQPVFIGARGFLRCSCVAHVLMCIYKYVYIYIYTRRGNRKLSLGQDLKPS